MEVPPGRVERIADGGPEAIRAILAELRAMKFNGLLKTSVFRGDTPSRGVLVLRGGDGVLAEHRSQVDVSGQAARSARTTTAIPRSASTTFSEAIPMPPSRGLGMRTKSSLARPRSRPRTRRPIGRALRHAETKNTSSSATRKSSTAASGNSNRSTSGARNASERSSHSAQNSKRSRRRAR